MAVQQILRVQGMKCDGCAESVERALRQVPGVLDVRVNIPEEKAIVVGSAEPGSLENAVIKAGYQATYQH